MRRKPPNRLIQAHYARVRADHPDLPHEQLWGRAERAAADEAWTVQRHPGWLAGSALLLVGAVGLGFLSATLQLPPDEARGTVVRQVNPGDADSDTIIRFQDSDRRPYEFESNFEGAEGDIVTVYFDSTDPADTAVTGQDHSDVRFGLVFFVAVTLAPLIVLMVYRYGYGEAVWTAPGSR